MAHRVFRLTIVPDTQSEVRCVIDFDGRSTLDDVYLATHRALLSVPASERVYAFFLSGEYGDRSTEYVGRDAVGPRADAARLFRLGLREGQRFVLVFDHVSEWRVSLTVTTITEVLSALAQPVVVESVGELNVSLAEPEPLPPDPSRVEALVPLGRAVLEKQDAVSALALAAELTEDRYLLSALDERLESEPPGLLTVLFDLGLELSEKGAPDEAIQVLRAYAFMAKNELNGDLAIVYARAGRREEALAQVELNLSEATYPYIAESKAGDAYHALGELDSAEAYHRRALAVADSAGDRREGLLHLSTFLIALGREAEASELLQSDSELESQLGKAAAATAGVGRNDLCPCGSGKKYKKCHGT